MSFVNDAFAFDANNEYLNRFIKFIIKSMGLAPFSQNKPCALCDDPNKRRRRRKHDDPMQPVRMVCAEV